MVERTSYENGTPCWVDIGTSDTPAAIDFYSKLFGWEIELGPPEMGHYSMAMVRDHSVAALADQQTPGAVFWTTYLATDDVDATTERVLAAGGTVLVEPMDVMTFGRMSVVLDTGGAPISFWQAGDHTGAGLVNEPNTLCWNELTTRAVDESIAFYRDVVGLEARKIDWGHGDYYELYSATGSLVGGLMPMIGDMWPAEIPNHWMVYFAVDDTDAAAARCVELGGSVAVPPSDIPPGRFAVCNDPQGAHFSIIAMTPMPAA
jgi:predicted enzyme related to lactoylglutathione lyase